MGNIFCFVNCGLVSINIFGKAVKGTPRNKMFRNRMFGLNSVTEDVLRSFRHSKVNGQQTNPQSVRRGPLRVYSE